MATPKRKKRRSHPVTKQELRDNNPNIVEGVTDRLGPYYRLAVAITAIGALLWGGAQLYTMLGGRWMVSDYTLDHAISNVKTEVNTKIDSTKNEVVQNQNAIKGEITGSISQITKTLDNVAKSQNASAMDAADMALKLAFTQLQSVQGQLATWKQALAKDPNDQQAQMRVLQLETFVKQNEQDMKDAKDKIAKLRENRP